MYMKLIKLLEGICFRKDGESDEEFVQRCGNELTREPDKWNDRETSQIKLQKLMAKKKLPKDMKWNQGFELEEEMPGGAFVGLTSPSGYINGAPSQKKKKKQEEEIVNDNEVDRNDVLLNKLNKALIKIRKKGNVLESHVYDCPKCGHTWEADKGGKDETICHKCGHNLYSVNEIDTADHPKDCKCKDCVGNEDELDILGTDLDETQEDWMARKTQEILDKYKETRLKGLKEAVINKPSPKLRPEPHPTRHETEHPPYEKDAMKPKGKYTPPTKK